MRACIGREKRRSGLKRLVAGTKYRRNGSDPLVKLVLNCKSALVASDTRSQSLCGTSHMPYQADRQAKPAMAAVGKLGRHASAYFATPAQRANAVVRALRLIPSVLFNVEVVTAFEPLLPAPRFAQIALLRAEPEWPRLMRRSRH